MKEPSDSMKDVLRKKEGQNVDIALNFPPLAMNNPAAPGTVTIKFVQQQGKLLHVWDDGVAIRGDVGEVYFEWERIAFVGFPSDIVTNATPPLAI